MRVRFAKQQQADVAAPHAAGWVATAQGCQHGELPRWVEDARSLGMISQTSGTLYGILSRYVPSALSGEQQQGLLPNIHHNSFAAPHGKPLKLGLYPGGSAHPGT